MLEGPPGIGKTCLVVAAGRHGRELGLTTLSARGSELERDFAYGVVRQLFEAPLVAAPPPERAELIAGAAGHAAALFGVAAAQEDMAGVLLDPSFAILHGLYWLCANLGGRCPLLLCIDDVHWADQASLRFLHYLGRRLEELPIAVVAASRPAQPGDGAPVLAALAADPLAEVFVLPPLSERAVAELVRLGLGTGVEPGFAAACHEATGGVPFLVGELIRAIAETGIKPAATAASRVAALAPRAVSHSVVYRLSRLSAAARRLAPAAAVLGEADLRLAASIAGLAPGAAATAADELAAAGILEEGRPLRFIHPIVRAAVEADLPPGERAGLHAAAARRLANEGASAHRVAAHLLAADPAADDWVVDSLLSAARVAIASGAPGSAVAYLRRALAEPPSGQLRPVVLLELGFAESYAGDPQRRLISSRHSTPRRKQPIRSRSLWRWAACCRSTAATTRRWRYSTGRAPALPAPTAARRSRSRAPPSVRPSSTRKPQAGPPGASPACACWPRNSPACRRACSARWRSPPRWRTSGGDGHAPSAPRA